MQQEENHRKSGFTLCDVTPEKLQRMQRERGSFRKEIPSHSQESKRKIHYSPRDSPNKYQKTSQSSGSFRKDEKSQFHEGKSKINYTPHNSPDRYKKTPQSSDVSMHLESGKRKLQSSRNESPEKIQKAGHSGKFINALIGQWSKHMGLQTPLSQAGGAKDSPVTEEMKRKYTAEDRKIQVLQKKLQAAEENVSSLSVSHEAELRAKEEILQQLNTDWESITKYYSEISESLKGFQEHKDNLSEMYNNVIVVQQSTVKKLQQELNNLRLKDEERMHTVAAAEDKVLDREKRIEEMKGAESELKKKLEDFENQSISEKNRLETAHAEEKLELIKKQERLTSVNEELQSQIRKFDEDKRNLMNLFEEKDKSVSKLEEEISTCKNKIEDLLCKNTELNEKCEQSVDREKKLSDELQLTVQEISRLRENLNARQEIELSLAKDLDQIESKYKNTENNFINMENKLKKTQDYNIDLERMIGDMKSSNDRKLGELSKKIEILEKEKEKILSEKRIKIQELESTCKLLKEKHEDEERALKNEFHEKLSEMKKTISSQNSAFIKLNETLNQMKEESRGKGQNIRAEGSQNKSRRNVTDTTELYLNEGENLETILQEINRTHEVGSQKRINRVIENKEHEEGKNKEKRISDSKSNVTKQTQQDIYSFNTMDVNKNLQNILSPLTQEKRFKVDLRSAAKISSSTQSLSHLSREKDTMQIDFATQDKEEGDEDFRSTQQNKKIFKTRNTGLRQYGSTRKLFKK